MMKKKKTNKNECSTFEEMLMWTSYRYCIGRHTYVTSMSGEMAQHYYNKLSDERKEFTAYDIRREIYDKLKWLPFDFEIHRIYNDDELNPINALLTFIDEQKIDSMDEFVKYSRVEYNSHTKEYSFDKCDPTIKSYFSIFDIEDLIPWENLAACFDTKNHKMVTVEYDGKKETVRCFKSWRRKCMPCPDKPGYWINTEFGWEPVWVDVDNFVKTGNTNRCINNEYVTKIEIISNESSN